MKPTSADLVLIDGKVLTMNPIQPVAEAVAVRGDRIVRVGTTEEVSYLIGKDTKIVYLDWRCVVPGFIDTHIHVGDYARYLLWMDLSEANSIKDLQSRLAKHLEKAGKGKWVVGRGWDENHFEEKRFPTRLDLDAVSPDNPVIFYYACGPICVVNSKALETAGITKDTSDPLDGTIEKDGRGEPTGILRDTATDLVWSKVPEPSEAELVEASVLACEKIVASGITSIHWLATSKVDVAILHSLCRMGRLPLRVNMAVPLESLGEAGLVEGLDGEMAKIGGVEVSLDGYLATRTASLFQPYHTNPEINAGLLCKPMQLQQSVQKIVAAGFQPIVHAMGDKAVDAALKAFENVPQKSRPRIDPAALLNNDLVNRIKDMGVVVSVQPLVAESEFRVYSAEAVLGEDRARWLYPLKSLVSRGVRICGGSDCPMEPLNPLLSIQSVVTRQYVTVEQLSLNDALRMYTINAAYASGEENQKGSVEEGKLADLTVLSKDPREGAPDKIGEIKVEMTVVGGKPVFLSS